jgi:transposase
MSPREVELTQQLAQCQAALDQARQENTLLRQKIDLLVRRVFGSSSEALDPAQLQLLLQLPSPSPEIPKPATAAQPEPERSSTRSPRSRGPRLPDHLPVVEEVIEPEPVKAAPQDWRCIGQEVTEQLDYEPGRFLRRRLIRKKYVHRTDKDQAPVIAALPDSLLERGLPAAGLLAHVLISKYCDHLPLYRQEQIFRQRHNVELPRQTLARWVDLAAEWLKPIYKQIRTGVLADGYVQMDETPIRYLEPGNGKTKQGYLWTGSRPGGDVFYHWETTRAAACLQKIIPVDFTGTVQCDGYFGYRSFATDRKGKVTLAGCWAHVRRKIYEALEESPRTAAWLLRQIQHLYRVEAQLREGGAGPVVREAVRAHQSRPIIQRLHRAFTRLKAGGRHLPQSLVGTAIDYALGQWPTLEVFLKDGRIEIDNNLVENAIRPTAVGKKNWLFIGEAGAGQRGAIIYTVIESCRRRGIDPHAYLCDVLKRLPSMTNQQIPQVLPGTWRQKQNPAVPLQKAS